MAKWEDKKMRSDIETVRKYVEDQSSVVFKQHGIISKYARLVHILAFALQTETGLTAAEWIDWAKMKVAEIDGETA